MEKNKVVYDAERRQLYHGVADILIRLSGQEEPQRVRMIRAARLLPAAAFAAECRPKKKRKRWNYGPGSILAVSLADIEKALQPKQPADPRKAVALFRTLLVPWQKRIGELAR